MSLVRVNLLLTPPHPSPPPRERERGSGYTKVLLGRSRRLLRRHGSAGAKRYVVHVSHVGVSVGDLERV